MRKGKLLCFGNGGHSIEYGGMSRLSGYDRPETFDGWDEVQDGCPVLDKRPAIETEEGYKWVFRGPMVNVDIPDDEIDRCPDLTDNPMVHAMMSDSGNSFGFIASLQVVNKAPAGPLDSVSTKAYIQGWVERGARQGAVQGRSIVWS